LFDGKNILTNVSIDFYPWLTGRKDDVILNARLVALILVLLCVTSSAFSFKTSTVKGQTTQKCVFFKTYFTNSTNLQIYISLQSLSASFQIANVQIRDTSNNNVILSLNGQNSLYLAVTNLKIEKGRFYNVTVQSSDGSNFSSIFYRSDHILELMPSDVWLGNNYLDNYEEYLQVFENAYNLLISLTRNGTGIQTNGVTLNRPPSPWGTANGGNGVVNYPVASWFEQPLIVNKVYLPNGSATVNNPNIGSYNIGTSNALETRLHELTHAVLLETPGSSLLTQEGNACFFETNLFRLLGYDAEYIFGTWNTIDIFREYVYDDNNFTNIAVQFANSDPHIWPGGWIPAFIIEDFVGHPECEQRLIDFYASNHETFKHIDLVPDQGWSFLSNYFYYASTIQTPQGYNNDERLLYYFELSSNMSLKQTFLSWGFNVSSYVQLPPPTPTLVPTPTATPTPTPTSTPTSSPTPPPEIPESPSIVILLGIVGSIVLSVLSVKKGFERRINKLTR
jgi:hypothetical protein